MDPDRSATVSVLSEICTNLAAGWFGLLLIAPATIGADSPEALIMSLSRTLTMGISFSFFAITLRKEVII